MAVPLQIELSQPQRTELEKVRDHARLPYLRERAAAILKIADGASGRQTARRLLLRPRWQDTIYDWVKRYRAEGLAGLKIKAGRGRKPAFAPQYSDEEAAREALLHTLHQSPAQFGQKGSRWQLSSVLAACGWLKLKTRAGCSQLLRRLHIHWKQARAHVHSPDAAYVEKLREIRVNVLQAGLAGAASVLLFQDEFTLYRQPRLGRAYEATGHAQPLAELGWKSNSTWRIVAALNSQTGQVSYAQGAHIDLSHLVKFYQQLVGTYPSASVLWLVQDNWPVHFHADVLAALQPQEERWPHRLPPNWPSTASPSAQRLHLPIQILSLPTYASWTNPIEKLWRLLSQEVLCLHRFADDWAGLKQAVTAFLNQFTTASSDLLRYVGLSDPYSLYRVLFQDQRNLPLRC